MNYIGWFILIWVFTILQTIGTNKLNGRKYTHFCKLSIRLPSVISFMLFLTVNKRKVPVWSIISQATNYIIFLISFIISSTNPNNVVILNRLNIILLTTISICFLGWLLDSMINTERASKERYYNDTKFIKLNDLDINLSAKKLKKKSNKKGSKR